MPPKVHFFFNSALLHFTQLITGLELLHQKKEIDLEYSFEQGNYPIDICRVNYEGKTLIFDMADSAIIKEHIYEDCDFYIKRMLLRKDLEKKHKLIPFGLNFMVFFENQFMRKLLFKKKFFKYGIRYDHTFSRLLNIKNSISTAHLDQFKAQPEDEFKALFRTRLWNPENNSSNLKKKEREKMNQERISIIRAMNSKYKNSFVGGIEKDDFSDKICGDLLLSPKDYHKKNYFQLLKTSSVGIVNSGLEDSIGWKLGEYVAHGLAIVTTPVDHYSFRGDFKEGVNYLSFLGVREMMGKIELLHQDDKYRKQIQKNNLNYYHTWLEPAAKVRSIFKDVEN